MCKYFLSSAIKIDQGVWLTGCELVLNVECISVNKNENLENNIWIYYLYDNYFVFKINECVILVIVASFEITYYMVVFKNIRYKCKELNENKK